MRYTILSLFGRRPLSALVVGTLAIVAVMGPISVAAEAQDGPRWGRGDGEPMRRGGGMGGMRGMGGFGAMLEPEFLQRDIPLMVEGLGLDDAQSMILEALFNDYSDGFQQGVGVVNDAMREIGPRLFRSFMTPQVRERVESVVAETERRVRRAAERGEELTPEQVQAMTEQRMFEVADELRAERQASGEEAETRRVMGEMVAKLDAWRDQRTAMRSRLVDGIKAQLSEQQLATWPVFERRFDRLKSLPRGQISGESTDLIAVIDRLGFPAEVLDKIDPLLEQYEVRLDVALKSRNDYLAQTEGRLLRSIQELDMRTGMDIIRRQMQQRVQLRDVNEEFRAAIAYALPEEFRAEFVDAAGRASFDRIFRPTRADRIFESVRAMEGISDDALDQVDMIELAYRMEIAQFNERLVTLTKRHEPEEQLAQAERFAGMLAGGFQPRGARGEDPVRAAFNERAQMIDRHIERLSGVLSPEQLESLPQEPQRRRIGGGIDNLPPEVQERVREAMDRAEGMDPAEREAMIRQMRERWRDRGQGS